MPYLKINKDKLTPKAAEELVNLCPFSAISYKNNVLDIDAACKMCKMCVKMCIRDSNDRIALYIIEKRP